MKTENLEYRMYGLVPYNLSHIQQGIQFAHALQEYNNAFVPSTEFDKWKLEDKTIIILNGGTTNDKIDLNSKDSPKHYKGSLNNHLIELLNQGIDLETFEEPDLGDQLTAVVFLVDERVWNYEKYPERFLGGPANPNEKYTLTVHLEPETEEAYAKRLGGEQNVWMREFLSKFRLA